MSTRLHYNDYVAIRDLMVEIDGNQEPEDKLDPKELAALAKVTEIIGAMERKRQAEDAGLVPRTRTIYHKGRREVIAV